jgi:hypothetical protein
MRMNTFISSDFAKTEDERGPLSANSLANEGIVLVFFSGLA